MRIGSIYRKWRYNCIAALVVSHCMASAAFAAPPQSKDEIASEILFNEGNALAAKNDFAAAIPKFQASYDLAPANGTLFNLANAYERTGRLASAWKTFMRVVNAPTNGAPTPRQQEAEKRADALKPRLPQLTVVIPDGLAKTPNLEVFIDDEPLQKELWNVSNPVDPGRRKVTVNAPGKTSWSSQTRDLQEKDSERMQVPDILREEEFPKQRIVALTIGGLGAGAGIAAIVVGGLARTKSNDAWKACTGKEFSQVNPETECMTGSPEWFFGGKNSETTERPATLMASAVEYKNVAIALSVVSGVSLATASVLWFTASTAPKKDTAIQFLPNLAPGYAGGSVHFKF